VVYRDQAESDKSSLKHGSVSGAGEHGQSAFGDLDADIMEIVDSCTLYPDQSLSVGNVSATVFLSVLEALVTAFFFCSDG